MILREWKFKESYKYSSKLCQHHKALEIGNMNTLFSKLRQQDAIIIASQKFHARRQVEQIPTPVAARFHRHGDLNVTGSVERCEDNSFPAGASSRVAGETMAEVTLISRPGHTLLSRVAFHPFKQGPVAVCSRANRAEIRAATSFRIKCTRGSREIGAVFRPHSRCQRSNASRLRKFLYSEGIRPRPGEIFRFTLLFDFG